MEEGRGQGSEEMQEESRRRWSGVASWNPQQHPFRIYSSSALALNKHSSKRLVFYTNIAWSLKEKRKEEDEKGLFKADAG